jgi:YgiT-type zinc finger domain-containing protein
MKCVICKRGETKPGTTVLTFVREPVVEAASSAVSGPLAERIRVRPGITLVLKNVPAEVCSNCGEAYVSEDVSRQALAIADEAAKVGVEADIRDFTAPIAAQAS